MRACVTRASVIHDHLAHSNQTTTVARGPEYDSATAALEQENAEPLLQLSA
jgi:hypothetical protein